MNKIRKGDDVIVIAGRDKGKRGTVLRRVDAGHFVVEGINRVKKHVAMSTTARGAKTGGIEHVEAAIDASNVMVVDGDGNATRVGYRRDDEGRNVRLSRRSGKDLK